MIDSVESFSAMLRETLGRRLKPGAATFVEMFAEDGVMEFPYALPSPRRLVGREALVAQLAYLARSIELLSVSDVVKHETGDPEVSIVEFASSGRSVATGEPFEQRYISVIRVRDGHIVHYRDYWNPLAILRTTRGREFVESLAPR
jgi:ketosteroid isomerase-like protein